MDTIWKSNQNGLIVGCARSLGLLSLLLVYGVLGLEMTGEVVYDNTFGYRDSWYSSRNEFGDDVTLSGKARSHGSRKRSHPVLRQRWTSVISLNFAV